MKKNAIIIASVIALAVLLSVAASAAVVPTDYSAYGQVKLEGYLGGDAPALDGVFDDGEYQNVFEQKEGTAGFRFVDDASKAIIKSVRFGITVTDDAIYLGVEVSEPYYRYRGTAAGSNVQFMFGFNVGDKFYTCMDRQMLTLNIKEDLTLFRANTVLTYNDQGKFNGKDQFKYDASIYGGDAAKRYDDKGTTVYEVKLLKEKIPAAQKIYGADGNPTGETSITSVPDSFFVSYEAIGYDAAGNKGTVQFRTILSEEAKNTIKDQDGWVATFAPHFLVLTEKPAATEAETVPATTPESGATTTVPATQPGTNPTTGDNTVVFIILALFALAVPAVAAVAKIKKD